MTYCLAPEVVIQINQEHVRDTGEPYALINEDGLLSALGRPMATFGGVDLFPSVVLRAGALVDGMAQAHPFQQGNKRTAWDAVTTYLAICGMGVDASDDEATTFVLEVVEHEHDARGAALWFAERVYRAPVL